MVVAVLTARLFFPGAQSLKDKRRRIAGLMAKIRAGYPVSVAEVGHHELWQRGTIGVALVTSESRLAQSMFDRITDGIGGTGRWSSVPRHRKFPPEGSDTE